MFTWLYRIVWFIQRTVAEKDDQYISMQHMNEILREKGKGQ